jgi:hypothetical protein
MTFSSPKDFYPILKATIWTIWADVSSSDTHEAIAPVEKLTEL